MSRNGDLWGYRGGGAESAPEAEDASAAVPETEADAENAGGTADKKE